MKRAIKIFSIIISISFNIADFIINSVDENTSFNFNTSEQKLTISDRLPLYKNQIERISIGEEDSEIYLKITKAKKEDKIADFEQITSVSTGMDTSPYTFPEDPEIFEKHGYERLTEGTYPDTQITPPTNSNEQEEPNGHEPPQVRTESRPIPITRTYNPYAPDNFSGEIESNKEIKAMVNPKEIKDNFNELMTFCGEKVFGIEQGDYLLTKNAIYIVGRRRIDFTPGDLTYTKQLLKIKNEYIELTIDGSLFAIAVKLFPHIEKKVVSTLSSSQSPFRSSSFEAYQPMPAQNYKPRVTANVMTAQKTIPPERSKNHEHGLPIVGQLTQRKKFQGNPFGSTSIGLPVPGEKIPLPNQRMPLTYKSNNSVTGLPDNGKPNKRKLRKIK
jgi:hypothetical protein